MIDLTADTDEFFTAAKTPLQQTSKQPSCPDHHDHHGKHSHHVPPSSQGHTERVTPNVVVAKPEPALSLGQHQQAEEEEEVEEERPNSIPKRIKSNSGDKVEVAVVAASTTKQKQQQLPSQSKRPSLSAVSREASLIPTPKVPPSAPAKKKENDGQKKSQQQRIPLIPTAAPTARLCTPIATRLSTIPSPVRSNAKSPPPSHHHRGSPPGSPVKPTPTLASTSTTIEHPRTTLFSGLRLYIHGGHGRGLTTNRARLMTQVALENGATIVSSPDNATHIVVGAEASASMPDTSASSDAAVVVVINWITDCVTGQTLLPTSAYQHASAGPSPSRSPLREESPPTATKPEHLTPFQRAAAAGYMPVFFNSKQEYLDVVKPFACQQGAHYKPNERAEDGSAIPLEKDNDDTDGRFVALTNPNQHIIDELSRLKDIYEKTGDHWRKYSYNKAIGLLKRHYKPIRRREDVIGIPGIGERIAQKIEEIVNTGTSEKVQFLESSEEVRIVSELGKVWGIGPTTAKKLYMQGVTSLEYLLQEDVQERLLTRPQRVGLKYHDVMDLRIPRREVAAIEQTIREIAQKMNTNLELTTCGSYRRGKPDSGDVDILMCDRTGRVHDGVLELLLPRLQSCGFIVDELSTSLHSRKNGEADTWMGFCILPPCENEATCPAVHRAANTHYPRRLDLKVYAKEHFPFAILYFTGSDYFNRSMRLFCQKQGMSLSDRELKRVIRVNKEKVHEGEIIPCDTEEAIFKAIGLDYKTPEERSL